MSNTKYNKLESVLSEMGVLSHKVVELLNETDCCDNKESKPCEETTCPDMSSTPDKLSKLDIQPGDRVKIEPYFGFLPEFARGFTYDEASTYEVLAAGLSRYNMPVYILSDCTNKTSIVPHCCLKLVLKASEPAFKLDDTSDPQGIMIKSNITGKAVIHINMTTAIDNKIDPVTLASTLCAFLNNAVTKKETSGNLEA